MAHAVLGRKLCSNCIYQNLIKRMSSSVPKVFATRNDFPSKGIELLKSKCNLEEWNAKEKGDISRSDLLQKVKGMDALYVKIGDKIDKELLDAAGDKLKVIGTMSVGVDHVDLALMKERGIKLGYTPDVLTEATAELTMALLLATSRNLFIAHEQLATGGWKSWEPLWMCGPGLENSTVGIVGFGRIGQSVARKLIMFQVSKLLYTSRSEKPFGVTIGAEKTSLDDLLQRSDFVICSTALTSETKGMFNAEKFSKMKPTAIFINISRGGLVDQDALVSALENRTIRAAGLDVMTPEPLPTDHKLLQLKNCCLIPHIGSATFQARQAMSMLTGQNILAALEMKPMPSEYSL